MAIVAMIYLSYREDVEEMFGKILKEFTKKYASESELIIVKERVKALEDICKQCAADKTNSTTSVKIKKPKINK